MNLTHVCTLTALPTQSDVELSSLDCSAGYYCPTPAEQLECPPGSFCAARSTSPITCNYETLLST